MRIMRILPSKYNTYYTYGCTMISSQDDTSSHKGPRPAEMYLKSYTANDEQGTVLLLVTSVWTYLFTYSVG